MPGGENISNGELYRISLRIENRIDQVSREMVGRAEYESDQEAQKQRQDYFSERVTALEKMISAQSESIKKSRYFAITSILSAAGVVISLLAFIVRIGGV